MENKSLDSVELRDFRSLLNHGGDLPANVLPERISAIGSTISLRNRKLALFSSRKCPGDIILKTFDLAKHLRETGVTVIGGFHSPMEQECLRILFRGKQPVIICPARSIESGRPIKPEWKAPLEEGRLLVLSPFAPNETRISAARSAARNRFVAAIADDLFFAYADPGGKLEVLGEEAVMLSSVKKRLFTFDSPHNQSLIQLGVTPVEPDSQFNCEGNGGNPDDPE